ncbi:MAG TPA: putative toxin-antitoxin system toxin component, PIN family [Cyclobacteriaceae bacterium]|nr:putative toxin-antitoxin system toxin component, PIN family [Cyclobacteriaceae bacterium]
MPEQKANRLIVDTNLWVSFLIGKELYYLKDLIVRGKVKLVVSDQLLEELQLVTSRPKLSKYFEKRKVDELLNLIELICDKVKVKKIQVISRDPKDDFLLALAKEGKADFLLTGDKDLLEIGRYHKTEILTITEFKKILG